MKIFIFLMCTLVVIAAITLSARPAEQTWSGEISDSHCRAEHQPIAEDDPVLPSPECVKICLKNGFKYVFVVDEKVYSISNQDHADLAKFAGQAVKLTGELKGDTIAVAKIEASGR
jgi:hypothetical protein